MSVLVILSLKRHWWWWHRVNLCCRPVYSPLAIDFSPRDSDHIEDGFFVPPVLLYYPPDLSRSEYTSCRPDEALGTVAFHSQPHLYLGFTLFNGSEDIGLASTFSPNGTNSCVVLSCNLSNGVRPSRPFWHLHMMLPACSTDHSKIGESSRSSSCVQLSTWHLMVLMTPRNNITAFSTNPFESLSPLTASSSATSALQFSATSLLA